MMQVGELTEALDAIKWGVDYLLNCHTEPMKFVAMYGSSEVCTAAPLNFLTGGKGQSPHAICKIPASCLPASHDPVC